VTDTPPWGTDTGRACAAAIIGATGHLVEADAVISNGPAALHITGLPEDRSPTTHDRIRAALINAGMWPGRTITVTLLPASLPKHTSALDLAIAVAALTAAGAAPPAAADRCVFTAELGLDGSLRPVRGVLPAVLAAAAAGCTQAVVAPQNAAEAAMVPGVTAIGCASLQQVRAWLRGDPIPAPPAGSTPAAPAGLAVRPAVRRALEASAAGGHHLGLAGKPDTAIPALAQTVARLLPPLGHDEAIEVAAIRSAAGLLPPWQAPGTRPPYRAPHHTMTRAAAIGTGGRDNWPGVAALAHRGVLFLGQAPEFGRDVLAALRQPLHDGQVSITRGTSTVSFPAKFILIAGVSPCPCAGQPGCSCSGVQARRYRARFTSGLGTYVSLWLHIARPGLSAARRPCAGTEAVSAARVAAARDRAAHRLRGTPWQINGDIPAAELRRSYQLPPAALAPILRAIDLGQVSHRAAHQVIAVAWTLADLAGKARPGAQESSDALAFCLGEAR
jgi:magnesium chelatase family protein